MLTDLAVDAYHDFAVALATVTRRLPPPQRLPALAGAYRAWANTQPHRYRLLFAAPLPGYDAHSARLLTAAQEAMNVLLSVLTDLEPATTTDEPSRLSGQLDRWARNRPLDHVGPTHALRAVTVWTHLHGLASLEIEGNYAAMGLDPELLFDTAIDTILQPPRG